MTTAGSSGEQAGPGPDGVTDETREELPGLRGGERQGSAEGGKGRADETRGKREGSCVYGKRRWNQRGMPTEIRGKRNEGIWVFFFAGVSSKGLAWASRRQAAGKHVQFG